MTTLDATSVAALLREFGQRSALRGDNPFRAKAYARAADNLLALSLPLDQVIAEERLREIPGVGEAMLIPEEAAPQFRDNAAPRNGMMPPPDSEMIAPPITE